MPACPHMLTPSHPSQIRVCRAIFSTLPTAKSSVLQYHICPVNLTSCNQQFVFCFPAQCLTKFLTTYFTMPACPHMLTPSHPSQIRVCRAIFSTSPTAKSRPLHWHLCARQFDQLQLAVHLLISCSVSNGIPHHLLHNASLHTHAHAFPSFTIRVCRAIFSTLPAAMSSPLHWHLCTRQLP
jgi:hypothetical protein